ncbi:hypothetical protein [Tibeticola sp.]|uniref:hypothetical protein n=1 Tax=Tibeticola sp. TaxID=2005368 RepID=UPI0025F33259|nr:hypothetical protein [Tibeticola sp.]
MNDTGHALFVSYGGGHITKVAPVVKHLQSLGVSCTVLALTIGFHAARVLGLSPVGYRDFMHLVDADRAIAMGRSLLEGNRHPLVDEHESACYLGVNYLDWVEQFGPEEAARRYARDGRRGFYPLVFMGRLLDHLKPSVVVSTSSPRSEHALLEAARQRGIPSLTMMDLFALPYDPYVKHPVKADRITVMSERVRANLMAGGVDAAMISVTGCPAYDALHDPAHVAAARDWRAARGWSDLHVVMWAGYKEDGPGVPDHWFGTAFGVEVERRLRDWVSRRPDVALLVRYHPNQYHEFPFLGDQPRVHVAVSADEPAVTQLHASDVVIVQTSTIGLEAALIGKRVLNLTCAPSVIDLAFDYSVMGIAEPVPRLEDLTAALDQAPSRPPGVEGLPPPPAAPRVAAEILDLMQRAPARSLTTFQG